MLVLILAPIMVQIIVSMLVLSSQLYTTSRDSSRMYSRYQSCYAVAELSCYQYIMDLCAVTATQNLNSDWITSEPSAMYSEAIDSIICSIGTDTNGYQWHITNAETLIAGLDVSDSEVLVDLLGDVVGVRQELSVVIQNPLTLDWSSDTSWEERESSLIKLDPFFVDVKFTLRNDSVQDRFYVDNMYLSVEKPIESESDEDSEEPLYAIVKLTEGEGGAVITREMLENLSEN